MKHYFLPIEENPHQALNSLWATLYQKRFEPDIIHVVFEGNAKETLDQIVDNIKIIVENYDLNCEVDSLVLEEKNELKKVIEKHNDSNSNLSLDISGASKYLTGKILSSLDRDIFDYIFLTEIAEEDRDKMFPTIDHDKLNVIDLKTDVEEDY